MILAIDRARCRSAFTGAGRDETSQFFISLREEVPNQLDRGEEEGLHWQLFQQKLRRSAAHDPETPLEALSRREGSRRELGARLATGLGRRACLSCC